MFRKKTKTTQKRSVNQQQRAPVFSNYARRSQSRPSRKSSRGWLKSFRAPKLRKAIAALPTFIAVLALMASVVYISTLDTPPVVQIVSSSSEYRTLVEDRSSYKDEFTDALAASPMNRSKLLIDTDKIARELTAEYPELGEVLVVLPLVGRRPIFKVRPAEPAIVLNSPGGGPYIVDTNGRVLADTRKINDFAGGQLPVVQDESDLPTEPGKVVLTAETIEFISVVTGQLDKAGVKLGTITLPRTSVGEVDIRIKNKPYFVKFDTKSGEGRRQAGTFLAVKSHLEKQGITPRQYVDVRVGEKAFYK